MSGPFTTITVDQFNRMTDTIAAADALARTAKSLLTRLRDDGGILPGEFDNVDDALAAYESIRIKHGPGRIV